jgi:hypothetical protein
MNRVIAGALCSALIVVLAGCGQRTVDEQLLPTRVATLAAEIFDVAVVPPTPVPAEPTATPAPAVTSEAVTVTETLTDSAAILNAADITNTEEVTAVETITGTEGITSTDAVTASAAITATGAAINATGAAITDSAEIAEGDELTATAATASGAAITASTEITAGAEVTATGTVSEAIEEATESATNEITTTSELTDTGELTATHTITATESVTGTEEATDEEATEEATEEEAPASAAATDETASAEELALEDDPALAGLPEEILTALASADPARGQTLTQVQACIACHTTDPNVTMVGPTWHDIATTAATRVPGVSSGLYLYNSIIHPNDYVVEGYLPNIMLQIYGSLPPEDLADIVSYLLTLEEQP